jgi:hypothetical protein
MESIQKTDTVLSFFLAGCIPIHAVPYVRITLYSVNHGALFCEEMNPNNTQGKNEFI